MDIFENINPIIGAVASFRKENVAPKIVSLLIQ